MAIGPKLQKLHDLLQAADLAPREHLGELTVEVPAARYLETCTRLRDDPALRFEQAVDLCGIDYSTYAGELREGPVYGVVLHLLSYTHNWRLRVKCLAEGADLPRLPSVIEIWPGVNWYEREAFDLFGIVFDGHPDLRRILTDYGFVGHPFRKDFPISGNVEMRYDPDQKRVVYQPVTIEPREIVPRIVREPNYGESEH